MLARTGQAGVVLPFRARAAVDGVRLADSGLDHRDRIVCKFRDLGKRGDDGLILEEIGGFAESYSHGRAELAVSGDWHVGSRKYKWIVRVVLDGSILKNAAANDHVDISDVGHCDGRDEHVVLVEAVGLAGHPQQLLSVAVGPYLVEDNVSDVGDGLLYCQEISVAHKVLPRFMEREPRTGGPGVCLPQDVAGHVVKSGADVMEGITDDERKRLSDWLFGPVGQFVGCRVVVEYGRAYLAHHDLVKSLRERLGQPTQFVDVVIGPFNL